ncbi:MAG: hypothetical protein KC519_19345 [Anaerolineae bacterium]|nr:hypothetical protein [Anaerolineae bacterium]
MGLNMVFQPMEAAADFLFFAGHADGQDHGHHPDQRFEELADRQDTTVDQAIALIEGILRQL